MGKAKDQEQKCTGSHETTDELIKQLLSKAKEEELNIALYGYPSNYLDDPIHKTQIRRTNEAYTSLGNDYVGIEILRCVNGDVIPGMLLDIKAPNFLVEFGSRKGYISTKKLRSLIYDHLGEDVILPCAGGSIFYVKLRKQVLLDAALQD